jgi:hypothetical protein
VKRSPFLETSFWSRLMDPPGASARRVTEAFLQATRLRFRLVVSQIVAAELRKTPDPVKRDAMLDRLWAARPEVVSFGGRADKMAWELITAGGWGQKRFADMLHVAYTLLSGAHALVT